MTSSDERIPSEFEDAEAVERIVLRPGSAHAGERLDVYLAAALTDFSRAYVQQLIAAGAVQVDGTERGKRTFKVAAGQTIEIALPEPEPIPKNDVIGGQDVAWRDKEGRSHMKI